MRPRDFAIAFAVLLFCSTLAAAECEISLPERSDVSDSMLPAPEGFVWVGSANLAALVPETGHWTGMGPKRNYLDKFWWWRDGYKAAAEPEPDLVITATRLDESSPPAVIDDATNAFGDGWDAMLVGMEFPTSGCWDVLGRYRDHQLRFVFKVGD